MPRVVAARPNDSSSARLVTHSALRRAISNWSVPDPRSRRTRTIDNRRADRSTRNTPSYAIARKVEANGHREAPVSNRNCTRDHETRVVILEVHSTHIQKPLRPQPVFQWILHHLALARGPG